MVTRNIDLLNMIDAFADRRLLVLGEAILDSYLQGTSERLSQEAPVPVVDVRESSYVPGGAANAAINLRSLGTEVIFLSAIGEDEAGSRLVHALEERGVSGEHLVRVPGRGTLAKQRIVAASQIVVRFDQGSGSPLDSETETELIRRLEVLFPQADGLIISDYGYGVITPLILEALARLQKKNPQLIVVDSKRLKTYRDLNVTAVKPNYEQARELLGLQKAQKDADRIQQISEHGRNVLDLTGAQIAAITLDHHGALVFHRQDEAPYRTYATAQPDSQAAGAGDTFASTLAASLAVGAHVEHAAEMASAAASIVVSKNGTAACFAQELKEYFSTREKFVDDLFQLALRVASYQRSGRKIVFTNGCFDILHRGHIAYLNRAKALGDILIIGLNSDQSVQRLKGPSRPINSLRDRAQVLAALSSVDHIVPFDEDTPHELIRAVKPDIFVKGGDYTREALPEAGLVEQLGGRVEILPYLESYSTTNIIEKIRNIVNGGAAREPMEVSEVRLRKNDGR